MLAAFSIVFVVTINYRLGVLGKKLTQSAGFGMGLILLPFVRWSSTRCHHQLQAGGFWVSNFTEPGGFGLVQSGLTFLSLPITTGWGFWVNNQTRGFGLGPEVHRFW